MPILENYEDRTPGSLVEEKHYALAWHYRKVDPELGQLRAGELKDALLAVTTNLKLGVMEGNNVIEVRDMTINKGQTIQKWISKKEGGFILAIGDDWTDESIFEVLPDSTYSIKVGFEPSKARFHVNSVNTVRSILNLLTERGINY